MDINSVYAERNLCVALLAAMANGKDRTAGWDVWRGLHVGDPWEADWRNIIFIATPRGQLSWHIHASELHLFSMWPLDESRGWDGHSTELKYDRMRQLIDLCR